MRARPILSSGREAIEEGQQEWEEQVSEQHSTPSDDDFRLADDEEVWWEERGRGPEVYLDRDPEVYFGNGDSTYNGNALYEDGNTRDENGSVLGVTVTGREHGMRITGRRFRI